MALQRIRSTQVGHAVMNALRRRNAADLRTVDIVPCANPDDGQATTRRARDAFGSGLLVRDGNGNAVVPAGQTVVRVGTGNGAPVTLYYSDRPVTTGASFDGGLVHELTHTFRMVQGHHARNSLSALRFSNFEEFIAVLIENMYDSSRDRRMVRTSYNFAPDPTQSPTASLFREVLRIQYEAVYGEGEEQLSRRWAQEFTEPLKQFIWTEPNLAQQLRFANCRFNPLRDFVQPQASSNDYPSGLTGRVTWPRTFRKRSSSGR